ncbi:hypothetical protein NSQ82_18935 [Caldifermentibacillus hisashii]|uniref:hypothetical protein n=1 Tax=Caldifermentibacillus hisashii TaxID=996558 RepID=UPI0031B7091A
MTTRSVLVGILGRKTPFLGDDTRSRRLFCVGNSTFWRRDPFSSSFSAGNAFFWRRNPFSSAF